MERLKSYPLMILRAKLRQETFKDIYIYNNHPKRLYNKIVKSFLVPYICHGVKLK